MNKKVQLLLVIVCGILFGVMIFAGYKLISKEVKDQAAIKMDEGASDRYKSKTNDPKSSSVPSTPRPYEDLSSEIQLDDEISPLNDYDLDAFFADYEDAVAWIYSPGTPIDYGVVEAEDNDFYLYRFLDGEYSISGSLFVDCKNARDFSDRNTIIYGHHMNNGTKFASLVNYREPAYYAQHPVLYLSTKDMNYRVEVFSAYLTDADSDCYTMRFESDADYVAYLQKICSRSDFKSNVSLSYKDRIITLSTCSYEYNDARYVVHGKLVPIH